MCEALQTKFENNDIMSSFRTLDQTNMSSRQVDLANWDVVDLKALCAEYGVEREFNWRRMFL